MGDEDERSVRQPILAVLAAPSPVGTFAIMLARALCQAIGRQTASEITLDSDEATAAFLTSPPHDAALIVSHYPRPDLVEWLSRLQAPTILAIDSPDISVSHALCQAGLSWDAHLRPLTQSMSLLIGARGLPRLARLSPQAFNSFAVDVIEQMALQLRLPLTAEQVVHVLSTLNIGSRDETLLAAIDRLALGRPRADMFPKLDEFASATIHGSCDALVELLFTPVASTPVCWPTGLFYDGERLEPYAPTRKPMRGPSRCLYYGPFTHLPVGLWQVSVGFALSRDFLPGGLSVEVYTDKLEGVYPVNPERSGRYRISFTTPIRDAQQPVQLRVFMDTGAIRGRIALFGAELTPVTDMHANALS